MDDQYWDNIADLTNILSNRVDMLLNTQKNAFTQLIVLDLHIAETKYLGYKSLLSGYESASEELAIEADFRLKISNLELKRQEVLMVIADSYTQMYEYAQDPFMLENQYILHTEAIA